MKKIIIIILLIMFENIYSQENYNQKMNDIQNYFMQFLDNCIDPDIKELIKISNKNEFIESFKYNDTNITYNRLIKTIDCFYSIDTLIYGDTNYIPYFEILFNNDSWRIEQVIRKCYYEHLNGKECNFANEIDSLKRFVYEWDSIKIVREKSDTLFGFYIPKDLDDALEQLNMILDTSDINTFRNYETEQKACGVEHHGIGMYIRNRWQVSYSRLHKYFANMGVSNHDLISSIILHSYYRKLHGNPIKFEELLIEYQKYQKLNDEGEEKYKNRYKKKRNK